MTSDLTQEILELQGKINSMNAESVRSLTECVRTQAETLRMLQEQIKGLQKFIGELARRPERRWFW